MDPQQELFTKLLVDLRSEFENVYDTVLPPEGTPYPFVYLADTAQDDDGRTKDALWGRVTQTLHVWHSDPRKRGTVSAMLLKAKAVCRNISETDNFHWTVTGITQNILPDDTTGTPLLHGVLTIQFYFT